MNADEIRILKNEGQTRAENRGYRFGNTRWKRGLVGTEVATFRGMLGEWAVVRWINERFGKLLLRLDLKPRPWGDGGVDMEAHRLTIDVKATPQPMVRRADRGRLLPLRADVYVFVDASNPQIVLLLGWITRARMCEVAPMRRTPIQEATHHNLEPPREELEPMTDLLRRLNVERRRCR